MNVEEINCVAILKNQVKLTSDLFVYNNNNNIKTSLRKKIKIEIRCSALSEAQCPFLLNFNFIQFYAQCIFLYDLFCMIMPKRNLYNKIKSSAVNSRIFKNKIERVTSIDTYKRQQVSLSRSLALQFGAAAAAAVST
jgi:hypothetical protein